jgi:NTE family protein
LSAISAKKIIEDYVDEVSQSLEHVASAPSEILSHAEKLEFLKIAKQPMVSLH